MRFSVNPLEDWENDDLLLTSGGRARLAQLYERIVPVLAWDELRTEFLKHEKLANEARRQSQGFGLQAVGLGAAGLILMSLTAMLIEAPPTLIIVTRVAAEAFLADEAGLAWATAIVSVVLFAAAAGFLRYLRP